jgi:hypothetical protein
MRAIISVAYTKILNVIYNQNIKYYNGLNIFPTDIVKSLKLQNLGFAFQA